MSSEKRAHRRYRLWFPVTIDTTSGQVYAICQDASAGGILITGSTGLAIGDVVTLTFRTRPQDLERRVEGKIVRVDQPADDPRSVWEHRMAVEFVDPIPELENLFVRASSHPPPGLESDQG